MSVMQERTPPSGRTRRRFREEFKADAVALVLDGDRSVASAARDLGIGETSLGNWVRRARVDRGERPGLAASERAELARLRRDNAQLRVEREAFERAMAFRVKESGRWPAICGSLPGGPKGSRPRRRAPRPE